MKLIRAPGATSQILQIFIADSSSTVGAGLSGLTSASSGLIAYYHRDTDTTATAVSLTTMTVGSFTSSGFAEIDATHMKGWYQFCPPDAALASGASSVALHLQGAANMAELPIEIDLAGAGSVWDILRAAHTIANSFGAATVTPPTNFSAMAITAGGIVEADIQTVLTNAVTATTTGVLDVNTKNIGNQAVTAAAGVTFPSSVASPTNITAGTITTVTNLTNAPTAGDLTATMKTSVTTAATAATPTAAAVTGAVGSVAGNVGGNITGSIGSLGATAKTDVSTAVLTTQMIESYAALNAVPTLAQGLLEMRAILAQASVSGTTLTAKKIDGSTTAETFTINSSTAPTSITRAS